MKLKVIGLLLFSLLIPSFGHSFEGWRVVSMLDRGWKVHRKQIIKNSILYGREHHSSLASKQIADRTALILDTWYKYKSTKLSHIKSPEILVAMAWTESSMQLGLSSRTHDKGIMQVSAGTAHSVCRKYGLPFNSHTVVNDLLTDTPYNVLVGLCEFDSYMCLWQNKSFLAVLSYKVGSGRLNHLLNISGGHLTKHYKHLYTQVLACTQYLSGDFSGAVSEQMYVPNTVLVDNCLTRFA